MHIQAVILNPSLPLGRLQGAFDTKDATGSAHAGITQAATYYPYDPTLGQYQYDRCVFCMLCHPLREPWSPHHCGFHVML